MAGHNTICGMQKENFCYWLVGARKLIIQKDVPNYRKDDFSGLRAWRNHAPSRRRDEAIAIFFRAHRKKVCSHLSKKKCKKKPRQYCDTPNDGGGRKNKGKLRLMQEKRAGVYPGYFERTYQLNIAPASKR